MDICEGSKRKVISQKKKESHVQSQLTDNKNMEGWNSRTPGFQYLLEAFFSFKRYEFLQQKNHFVANHTPK